MAKISAYGATKIDEFQTTNAVYVLCSDGRILSRIKYTGGGSSNYSLVRKCANLEKAKSTFVALKKHFQNQNKGGIIA